MVINSSSAHLRDHLHSALVTTVGLLSMTLQWINITMSDKIDVYV